MNDAELQLQEKVLLVFEELNNEVAKMSSKLYGLGWDVKCSYRLYVNSDYQNPEKYDAADLAWKKARHQMVLLKCLLDLFVNHRDLNGYFTDYNQFIKVLDDVIDELIKMEKYENVRILEFWRRKLPNPV